MSTITGRLNYGRKKKKKNIRTPALIFRKSVIRCPQIRALIIERRQVTPRKPNSALRKCVKVMLTNLKSAIPYVPGGEHNLRKYGESLISGGGARDLPGVRYSCIRGVLGLFPVLQKRRRRSIYGVKRPAELVRARRKVRMMHNS